MIKLKFSAVSKVALTKLSKKNAFTLAEVLSSHFVGCRKNAFTLAEVLITLGIIGVVAALTIPALMGNYKKHVVETRLKKFYTTMNQAIMLSEVDHGDKRDWGVTDANMLYDEYLKKYLNHVQVEDRVVGGRPAKMIYFEDGSAVLVDIYYLTNSDGNITYQSNGGHFLYYVNSKLMKTNNIDGINTFRFAFWPNAGGSSFKYHYNKGVEPYKAHWNGDPATFSSSELGCNNSGGNRMYCAALIQYNGWKIPKDYPFKF